MNLLRVSCRIVSSTGAIDLKKVPDDLIVVGGGVIGLEMGSVWSRLGAKVTAIEFTNTIVPSLDTDIRKAFERTLKKQGIDIKLNSKVQLDAQPDCAWPRNAAVHELLCAFLSRGAAVKSRLVRRCIRAERSLGGLHCNVNEKL